MKKTEYITFRADTETKEILNNYARSKKWSISLLVEDIVQQWIKENKLQKEEHDE